MFNSTRNDEAIARACVKCRSSALKMNVPANDVHQLLVRMTVSCADPALFHKVTHQHQLIAICKDLPRQTALWREDPSISWFHRLDSFSHRIVLTISVPSSHHQPPGPRH